MTKLAAGEDTGTPVETRYFIGVTPEGYRLSIVAGPGHFNSPAVPTTLGNSGIEIFPVSEAVKLEWDGPADDDEISPDDEDDQPAGDPLDECECGDYRQHHHDLGCTICVAGTPPPDGADGCRRFRLAFRVGAHGARVPVPAESLIPAACRSSSPNF